MQYNLKILPLSFGRTNTFTAITNICSSLAICAVKDSTKKTSYVDLPNENMTNNYCLVIDYYIYSDPTLKSPISDDPIVSVKLDSAFQAKEDVEFYKTYS